MTIHNHTTSFARSKNILGPYISNPRNPVLTHKHLKRAYPIQKVGHANMVELDRGECMGKTIETQSFETIVLRD